MDNEGKMLLILEAYYEKKYSNLEINQTKFNLEGKHEAAYILASLERDGLLQFDGKVIIPGGQRHPIFKNSVAMIWWGDAHITKDGEKELRKNGLV